MREPGLAEASALVAVLEQRSFARAAKALDLSPPRVSEMVRTLEDRLGVRLVERTTRSVAPTEAGERLFGRLRAVLDDYRAALDAAGEFRDTPAGTLRLTVAPPAADFVLAPVIARFLALHPGIRLDIAVDANETDIVSGRFDAGIRPGERVARDMIGVRISGDMPHVLVASPGYLERRGTPATPRDLAAHECLRFRLPSGALFPWRFRTGRRTMEVHIEGRVIVNEHAVGVRAAIDGAGLIQLPHPYVASALAAGRLVPLLADWAPPPHDGFFLYYPSRRQIRPPLKALVDFLRSVRSETAAKRPPTAAPGG